MGTAAATASTSADSSAPDRARFIEAHLDLVRSIATRIAWRLPPSVELDDLISAGIIGLLDAIDRYDVKRCNNFRRYAEIRIRGAILDELRSLDWVSRSVRRENQRLDAVVQRMTRRLGREPTSEEVAAEVGMEMSAYQRLLSKLKPLAMVSFEDLGSETGEERRHFEEFLADDGAENPYESTYFVKLRERLARALEELPERQRTVIGLYYFEDMNLKEIGRILGVTESRISQLHSAACRKLREVLHGSMRSASTALQP